MSETTTAAAPDSPEARRYNRIRRWLGIGELLLGLAFLVALVATGATDLVRNLALSGANRSYALAVFLYVAILIILSRLITLGLDYYGFRLEHRCQLSNQTLGSWIWDEAKGLVLTMALASALVELLYLIIRQFPERWWVLAWAGFL
ncbi:MAG: hypothetical protein J2P13_12490, partial [Acidobacteria bacterium]|nr:hypothetical protein [Acidobacteriota bacterium]